MHSPEPRRVPSPGSRRRAACLQCRGALPAHLPAPSTGQGGGAHSRGAHGPPALRLRQGEGPGALGLVLVILDVNSIKKITHVKPGCVRCCFSRSRAGRSGQGGRSPSPSRGQACPGVASTRGCCSLHIWLVQLQAALPTPSLGRAPHIPPGSTQHGATAMPAGPGLQQQPGAEPRCWGERERERRAAERGHGGSSCPDPAAKVGKRGAAGGP